MTRMKIGRWLFDIISLGVYFWAAVFLAYKYNLIIGIVGSIIAFLILHQGIRWHFVVKPYNAQVDVVNRLGGLSK